MDPTKKSAYKVVRYILEKKEFTQRGISEATGASLGGVNYTVKWLIARRYVAREKNRYKLVAAGGLLSLFQLNRRMEDKRIASFNISADRKQVLKFMKEKGAVLCLTTALQEYDSYFRDPSVKVYGDEKLAAELKGMEHGYAQVEIYRNDLGDSKDIITKNGFRMTSETRTVIDLFCSNLAYAAEQLVRRNWA